MLEMEAKEKGYNYQIELIKIQHKNNLKKMKNQFTANALSGL